MHPSCHLAGTITDQNRAQAIIEALAAYTVAEHPVIMLMTNGATYTILELRGRNLICWDDVSPCTAVYYTASWLKDKVCATCAYHHHCFLVVRQVA